MLLEEVAEFPSQEALRVRLDNVMVGLTWSGQLEEFRQVGAPSGVPFKE